MTSIELKQPGAQQDLGSGSRKPAPRQIRPGSCTDPIVGAILSGWRYDISAISAEMRIDYETHLEECAHCRGRQRAARTFDVLLLSVSSCSIIAFLLAAVLIHLHRGVLPGLPEGGHVILLHRAIAISLEAVAIAGLAFSTVLWILVAVATPLPSFFVGVVEERIPSDLRQRFARRHA